MKWAHLPVAGGLYDQDPRLIDQWTIMFSVKSEIDQEEADKAKNK